MTRNWPGSRVDLAGAARVFPPLRLRETEAAAIREEVARLAPAARVWLFDSRVDDRARGGDIALLVRSDRMGVTTKSCSRCACWSGSVRSNSISCWPRPAGLPQSGSGASPAGPTSSDDARCPQVATFCLGRSRTGEGASGFFFGTGRGDRLCARDADAGGAGADRGRHEPVRAGGRFAGEPGAACTGPI